MFDDEDRSSLIEQLLEDAHEHTHVLGVQAHGRFVEDEERVLLRLPELGGELEPLRLTAGQRRCRLVEGEIPEPHILQCPQPGMDLPHLAEVGERLGDGHRQQIRQRQRLAIGIRCTAVLIRVGTESSPFAVGTGDVDVGEELHVEGDLAGAFAFRAAQRARVVREIAGRQPGVLRRIQASIRTSEVVEDAGIGGHGGADVDADRGGVDDVDAVDPLGVDLTHMIGSRTLVCGLERGDEAVEDEGGLARSGHSRDDGQPLPGDLRVEGVDRVERCGAQPDPTVFEGRRGGRGSAHEGFGASGEVGADAGFAAAVEVGDGAGGHDRAAVAAGPGTDLDEVIGFAEDERIVVDHDDGVALVEEVGDDTLQAFDIRGVEPDRGFVEDVEDSGGLVANRAGELDALAFTGRQRGPGPVESEVPEAEVEQPAGHPEQRVH